jgi:hypothetical protein
VSKTLLHGWFRSASSESSNWWKHWNVKYTSDGCIIQICTSLLYVFWLFCSEPLVLATLHFSSACGSYRCTAVQRYTTLVIHRHSGDGDCQYTMFPFWVLRSNAPLTMYLVFRWTSFATWASNSAWQLRPFSACVLKTLNSNNINRKALLDPQ